MSHTIYHATLIYGLVRTPVGIQGTTTETKTVKFRNLHEACGHPIAQPKTCANPACVMHGKPLMSNEIIRGWEYAKGQFAHVTDVEYAAYDKLRQPVIKIDKFVALGYGPGSFPKKATYYLDCEDTLTNAYQNLVEVMAGLEVDGIGYCNMWDKYRPFSIASDGRELLLQMMFTADEIVPRNQPAPRDLIDEELDITALLVQERMGMFEMDDLVVENDRELLAFVQAKAAGKKPPKRPVKEKAGVATTDLMSDLKASIKTTPKRKPKKVAA
jgi:DNA end-binding protein Ku